MELESPVSILTCFFFLFSFLGFPKETDSLKHFTESRHLAVLRKGQWYVLEVIQLDGTVLTPVEIET